MLRPRAGTPRKLGARFPKTLTLFMTKICDFLCPIYDLTCFRPVTWLIETDLKL